MTPCVESQACHKQKTMSTANLIHTVHRFCRNMLLIKKCRSRLQNSKAAHGQKISPTRERNDPMTNLILPSGVPHGVSDTGIKFHAGPVTSTIKINNKIALEALK